MKRTALALTLIIVITISVIAWYFLIQTNNKAKIIAFTADMSWNNPVGVTMAITFNITVQNTGTNDIDDINIKLERITNENDS
jgi:hypothetical protein